MCINTMVISTLHIVLPCVNLQLHSRMLYCKQAMRICKDELNELII
jgi:hypothetical protein